MFSRRPSASPVSCAFLLHFAMLLAFVAWRPPCTACCCIRTLTAALVQRAWSHRLQAELYPRACVGHAAVAAPCLGDFERTLLRGGGAAWSSACTAPFRRASRNHHRHALPHACASCRRHHTRLHSAGLRDGNRDRRNRGLVLGLPRTQVLPCGHCCVGGQVHNVARRLGRAGHAGMAVNNARLGGPKSTEAVRVADNQVSPRHSALRRLRQGVGPHRGPHDGDKRGVAQATKGVLSHVSECVVRLSLMHAKFMHAASSDTTVSHAT